MCSKVVENAAPEAPFRPFCSPNCKLADLGNWMNETYRISRPLTAEDAFDEGSENPDDLMRRDELN
jgi:endogenous inhibitor of DNA gyrase (YacG/DUF329 family)